jgi:hypothetical protein
LADPSIADIHFAVTVKSGAATFEPVGASIRFGDGLILVPGEKRTVRVSSDLEAGDVPLRVEMAERVLPVVTAGASPNRSKRWAVAAMVAITVAGSAALAAVGRGEPSTPRLAVTAVRRAEADPATGREGVAAQLVERALVTIRVETTPEGSIRASGTITPADVSKWQGLKRWADSTYGGSMLLVDEVVVAAKPVSLAIQSAWLGNTPYVIDGSGEKLFVGAAVADGWMIEGIESGTVRLKRQSQRVSVKF